MGFRNSHNLLFKLLKFLVQIPALLCGVGGIGGLNRQLAHALEHGGDFVGGTLGHLDQGDRITRVADGLIQALNILRHPRSNGQARRIVFGRVDALAGGQLLHCH